MLKKVFIILIPIFLLVSCYPAFDMPHYRPHAKHYFDFTFLVPHFGINGILSIVIKILIIIALVLLIKMLYNKDKNNKKE